MFAKKKNAIEKSLTGETTLFDKTRTGELQETLDKMDSQKEKDEENKDINEL